jgi:hypothetical protein
MEVMDKEKDKKRKEKVVINKSTSWIRDKCTKCKEWIKNNFNDFLVLLLALGTFSMAISTCQLSFSNNNIVDLTRKTNERAEKLFIGQNKPLIDVTPIGIIPGIADDGNKMCATLYSVLNYSGFDANNISVDIAYGGNVYISEWLRAKKDSDLKRIKSADPNLILGNLYPSRPDVQIKELKSGEVKEYRGANGNLDLDKQVISMGKKGFLVHIRVTWENNQGHVFDEVRKYKLLCTKHEKGHSFTFIPEGIVSQKNQN